MNIQPWLDTIDRNTKDFHEAFGNLSEAQLNWKPAPNVWSIAQVIDHLLTIHPSYYPIVAHIRSGTFRLPLLGRVPVVVRFFGRFVLGEISVDRKKKGKTFPIWEPAQSNLGGDLLARYAEGQESLKKLITSTQDLLDKDQVIHSPSTRVVVYSLEDAYHIIVTHADRHLQQALEVKALLLQQK